MAATAPGGRAICVLGFSRSGTSLTARVLNLLGVHLGPHEDLLPPAESDNPRGYWEPQWMIELNDRILQMLGSTWWQPLPAAPDWPRRPEFEPLRKHARALMAEKYADVPIWGWKDPRTTLTLPFWRELVPDLSYVVCLRNPVDAVASLQRRPEPTLSVRAWGELWLEYTARALVETSRAPRELVFYEDFFEDGAAQIERLARFVGVEDARLGDCVKAAERTIASDLRHHVTSPLELAADPGAPTEARALFLALRAAEELRRGCVAPHATPLLIEAIERIAPELWWVNRLASDAATRAEAAAREVERVREEARLLREDNERLRQAERDGVDHLGATGALAGSVRRVARYLGTRRRFLPPR